MKVRDRLSVKGLMSMLMSVWDCDCDWDCGSYEYMISRSWMQGSLQEESARTRLII